MNPSNGTGIEEVRDSFRIWWIQDREALNGASMDVIRDYFNHLPDVPQGLDHDVCLIVNAASLESVLKDTTNSSESRRTKFAYAVDTEYGTHEIRTIEAICEYRSTHCWEGCSPPHSSE
ncbi:hypothetical protein L218DRAFT_967508 [Marasmius fiardii PR-910]|nr:hypothetical protein L218DRAFT_967508 [Marasmius fiardii PR-910]